MRCFNCSSHMGSVSSSSPALLLWAVETVHLLIGTSAASASKLSAPASLRPELVEGRLHPGQNERGGAHGLVSLCATFTSDHNTKGELRSACRDVLRRRRRPVLDPGP